MSKHLTEKFAKKLEKEGIQVKDNGIRFTVTHLNGKGKVLGRDWYKGYVGITDKRLALVSEGTKFLNIKRGDERFDSAQFVEDKTKNKKKIKHKQIKKNKKSKKKKKKRVTRKSARKKNNKDKKT